MSSGLARDRLWEVALDQHGFVTTAQAEAEGVSRHALAALTRRGRLERAAHGVYRFKQFPATEFDPFTLAVLWTGAPEACLSHETALACYQISDINPATTHLTVAAGRRIRRAGGAGYTVHCQNLEPGDVGWWNEVPTVKAAAAIGQCIAIGTPRYLLTQAITRGRAEGHLTKSQAAALTEQLAARGG